MPHDGVCFGSFSESMKGRVFVFAVLAGLVLLQARAAAAFEPRPVTQATVEALFTPHDNIEAAILDALRGARRSIHVQAYVFTSRALATALIRAKGRGVRVEMLADREQTARGINSQIPRLVAAGIPVALEVRYAAAHNKILLIDADEAGETEGAEGAERAEGADKFDKAGGAIITGSYNFTRSAQTRNAENVVILRGDPALLRAYFANWQRHRAEALPYAEALPAE
ncbi:MAG: phospholipase D family protein [Zoogloeaceae bacterium]|jgi:phosphatidylserine/phosphatidylglycerophosphate/cardiolipin synthase-like enzyme|nr:phospholipase D family protein [Zoogloeaceae bacterium]